MNSEITREESAQIARQYVEKAIGELVEMPPSLGVDHVRMYLDDALLWLGDPQ